MVIKYSVAERTRRALLRFIKGHRGWRVVEQAAHGRTKRYVVIVGPGDDPAAYEAIDGEFGRLVGDRPKRMPKGQIELRVVEV